MCSRRSISTANASSKMERPSYTKNYQTIIEECSDTTIQPLIDVSNQKHVKETSKCLPVNENSLQFNRIPSMRNRLSKEVTSQVKNDQSEILHDNFSANQDDMKPKTTTTTIADDIRKEKLKEFLLRDYFKKKQSMILESTGTECRSVTPCRNETNFSSFTGNIEKSAKLRTGSIFTAKKREGLNHLFKEVKQRHADSCGKKNCKENLPASAMKIPPGKLLRLSHKKGSTDYLSSRKNMRDVGKSWKINRRRSQINMLPGILVTSPIPMIKDQECKRTLEFPDCGRDEDEDGTKPLPNIDLSMMETDGSMMHQSVQLPCQSKFLDSSRIESLTQFQLSTEEVVNDCPNLPRFELNFKETLVSEKLKNLKLVSSLPNKINCNLQQKRLSGIPVLTKNLKLSTQKEKSQFGLLRKPESHKMDDNKPEQLRSHILGKKSSIDFSDVKGFPMGKNETYDPKPSNPLHKGYVYQPRNLKNSNTHLSNLYTSVPSADCPIEAGDCSIFSSICSVVPATSTISKPILASSCPVVPVKNTSSTSIITSSSNLFNSNNEAVKLPLESGPSVTGIMKAFVKDASTNTEPAEDLKVDLTEIERSVKTVLAEQHQILKNAQTYFQKMKEEFQSTSFDLLKQYEASFESIKSLQNILEGTLKPHQESNNLFSNATENDVYKSEASEEHWTGERNKTKMDFKFLGTPMPLKKKRLARSLSHPPCTPPTGGEYFHSTESIVSPFTNMAGNCERESLPPMTPGTRLNVTHIKDMLNEQLTLLFD